MKDYSVLVDVRNGGLCKKDRIFYSLFLGGFMAEGWEKKSEPLGVPFEAKRSVTEEKQLEAQRHIKFVSYPFHLCKAFLTRLDISTANSKLTETDSLDYYVALIIIDSNNHDAGHYPERQATSKPKFS